MANFKILTAKDVMSKLNVGRTKAYEIIREIKKTSTSKLKKITEEELERYCS